MMRTCAAYTSKRNPWILPPNISETICGKPSVREGEGVCKYHLKIRNNALERQLYRNLNKGRITRAEFDDYMTKLEACK